MSGFKSNIHNVTSQVRCWPGRSNNSGLSQAVSIVIARSIYAVRKLELNRVWRLMMHSGKSLRHANVKPTSWHLTGSSSSFLIQWMGVGWGTLPTFGPRRLVVLAFYLKVSSFIAVQSSRYFSGYSNYIKSFLSTDK